MQPLSVEVDALVAEQATSPLPSEFSDKLLAAAARGIADWRLQSEKLDNFYEDLSGLLENAARVQPVEVTDGADDVIRAAEELTRMTRGVESGRLAPRTGLGLEFATLVRQAEMDPRSSLAAFSGAAERCISKELIQGGTSLRGVRQGWRDVLEEARRELKIPLDQPTNEDKPRRDQD